MLPSNLLKTISPLLIPILKFAAKHKGVLQKVQWSGIILKVPLDVLLEINLNKKLSSQLQQIDGCFHIHNRKIAEL